ncbi:hypothetical protein ACROYT_G019529 [Oculina patagonica]
MEKMFVLLLSLLLFCGSSQGKDYTIVVETSSNDFSGTDAQIKIRVYGTTGNINAREIKGSFETGSTDTIHISDYDIGYVKGMAVYRNNDGIAPDWRLDRITIKISGKVDSIFNYNAWVSKRSWKELTLSCPSGYAVNNQGYCDVADVNECLNPSSCISPATCTNTQGSYYCSCPNGYVFKTGSRKECKDVDECLTAGRCASPTTCKNTPGSFYCECPSGYTKKAGTADQCEDIDECANNPCDHIKSTCENTAGDYKCNCKTGYTNMDAHTCINANECSMGTASCNTTSSECVDTEGNYYCRCKPGFTQGVNNKICDAINCGPLNVPAGSTLEPARCTQANANIYGDKCVMKCKDGYVIDDINNGILTCGSSGIWEGNVGVCSPVACPALSSIPNGNIYPLTCSSSGAKYTESCSYSCVSGYIIVGNGKRTCLADGTWDGAAPTCTKLVVRPWIRCPDNIYQDLAPGKSTAVVSDVWKEPTSNVQQITVNPPEISSSYQFPAGQTKVEWTASNSQGSESCAIYVIISDKESPKIANCPQDIFETTDNAKAVTWVEPTYSDNVKVESVDKTFNSGDTFQLGSTNVKYEVYDAAGNSDTCQFVVTLKRPACHDPDGPLDGTKSCSSFGGNNFCSVTCPSGSVVYNATAMFWQCNSGVWQPSEVIPDCVVSAKKDPNVPCEEGRIELSVLGFLGNELHCTKCPKGMYKSSTTHCSPCPAGTYNDQQGQLQCSQRCASGLSTLPGAKSAADCRPVCPAGRYSADGLGPNCLDCPRDTYQDQAMKTSCISCPSGTFTLASGSNSKDKCGSKPVVTVAPLESTIKEKESVSVNCYATGTPTPTYKWTFLRDIPADFLGQMSQKDLTLPSGDVIGAQLTITGATSLMSVALATSHFKKSTDVQ